jgi:hypothetical protein
MTRLAYGSFRVSFVKLLLMNTFLELTVFLRLRCTHGIIIVMASCALYFVNILFVAKRCYLYYIVMAVIAADIIMHRVCEHGICYVQHFSRTVIKLRTHIGLAVADEALLVLYWHLGK